MAVPVAPSLMDFSHGSYIDDSQIYLLWWPNNDNLISYKIYKGTSSGGEILLTTVSATAPRGDPIPNAYMVTGLTNGTTYYFKVSAVNSDGESSLSNEISNAPVAYNPLGSITASASLQKFIQGDAAGGVGLIFYNEDGDTYGALDNFYVAGPGVYGEPSGFDLSIYAEPTPTAYYMKFRL